MGKNLYENRFRGLLIRVATFALTAAPVGSWFTCVEGANKPRNTGEPHLFNPSTCKKVRFFQCYYLQNSTKGTESKAIQVSQMPGIEWKPQTAAPGIL